MADPRVDAYLAEARPVLATLAQAVQRMQDARDEFDAERQPTPDGGGFRVGKRVVRNLSDAERHVLIVAEALLNLGVIRA